VWALWGAGRGDARRQVAERMRGLCQGAPPGYTHRPYPCPKPVGELIAERDLPVFRSLVERWGRPGGLLWGMAVADYGRAGAWTEALGVAAPLEEMRLQSWDGALRVFPAWSRNLDARFENFRAEGAFLVTAAWSRGRLASLEIHGEKGAFCSLCSPCQSGIQVADESAREIPVSADPYGRPGFPTQPGTKYVVGPRS